KPEGGISGMALSPDGRTLAILKVKDDKTGEARLSVIGVDDKAGREIYGSILQVGRMIQAERMSWSRDGKAILVSEAIQGDNWRLLRIPIDGGKPAYTGLEATGLQIISPSPDGSRVAYSAAQQNQQIWALDNVNAFLTASR